MAGTNASTSASTTASTTSALITSTMSSLTTQFAGSSSSTFSSAASSLGPPPSEKLTRSNFLLWKAIVLPQIKGAQMEHHLDATSLAPPATIIITKDGKEEQVLNYARTIWYAQQNRYKDI